ncbi:hypothetical protein GCM10028781_10520 [Nostocoides australiense]
MMPLRPPRGYAGVAGSGGLDGLLADPGIQALGADATRLTLGLAVWAMIMGAVTAEVFSQYGTQAISDPAAHFAEVVELAVVVIAGGQTGR